MSLPVEALAQEIRRIDGSHNLGASALAEAMLPFIERHIAAGQHEDALVLRALVAAGDVDQAKIDQARDIMRPFATPKPAGAVPGKKRPEDFDDYAPPEHGNAAEYWSDGWNACRDAMLAAAPAPEAERAKGDSEKWGQQYRCGCFLGFATKSGIPRSCPQHMRDRQGSPLPLANPAPPPAGQPEGVEALSIDDLSMEWLGKARDVERSAAGRDPAAVNWSVVHATQITLRLCAADLRRLASAQQPQDDERLACDVKVAPGTTIRAGVQLSTLINCVRLRSTWPGGPFKFPKREQCCVCGTRFDAREQSEGGGPDGAQLTDGRWTCSPGCWERASAQRAGTTEQRSDSAAIKWNAWISDNDIMKLRDSVDDARNIRMSTKRTHLRTHPIFIPGLEDRRDAGDSDLSDAQQAGKGEGVGGA